MKLFAGTGDRYPDVASVLVRCSSVQNLLQPNSANQIERSLIAIAETSLPKLYAYQKANSKEQNYVKYRKLSKVQDMALGHLDPVYRPYGDLQVLVDQKSKILGALGHNALKDYLKCFGLDDVRSDIESIFGALSRIVSLEDTLFDDIETCQASIREATLTCDRYQTFLTRKCLAPFIVTVQSVLQTFLVTTCPFLFLVCDLAFGLLGVVDQVRGVTGEGDLDCDERVVSLGGGGLQVA